MIKDFKSKFGVLAENYIQRYAQGGLLTGDLVKIRKDAFKNPYISTKGENVKEMLRNMMESDLNIKVSAVKSSRPNSTGNYDGGFGAGTDAPTDYFVDIYQEFAPGLYRDVLTVPLEILEVVDTGINMAPIPDSMKRDSESTKPEEVDVKDANRKTPDKDTVQKIQGTREDGRDQASKPKEDKREKSGKLKKESLEDVYDGMFLTEKQS